MKLAQAAPGLTPRAALRSLSAIQMMEVHVPSTSFRFTNEDHVLLQALAKRLGVSQTDALRWAIRNMTAALRRGAPIYMSENVIESIEQKL